MIGINVEQTTHTFRMSRKPDSSLPDLTSQKYFAARVLVGILLHTAITTHQVKSVYTSPSRHNILLPPFRKWWSHAKTATCHSYFPKMWQMVSYQNNSTPLLSSQNEIDPSFPSQRAVDVHIAIVHAVHTYLAISKHACAYYLFLYFMSRVVYCNSCISL
jgi:hypothetical protein